MKKTTKFAIGIGIVVVIFLGTVGIVTFVSSPKAPAKNGQVVHVNKQTSTVTDNQPSPDYLPGTKFTPAGLTVPADTYVFDSKRVDVTGDGIADDVVLTGEKQGKNPYVQNISVAVKDGHNNKYLMTSIGTLNTGLDPKLFIGKFSKNGSNDILVSLATGGSGGVYQYSLLTDQNNQLTALVSQKELNQGLALETQCLSELKLKIMDKNTGYTTSIDLHKGLADYERMGIYNSKGKLLKDPMILVDGFGVLKPEYDSINGVYDLHGIQSISVGFHANSVANALSVWAIDNSHLKLLSEKVVPN
jgi:hypothetical protein